MLLEWVRISIIFCSSGFVMFLFKASNDLTEYEQKSNKLNPTKNPTNLWNRATAGWETEREWAICMKRTKERARERKKIDVGTKTKSEIQYKRTDAIEINPTKCTVSEKRAKFLKTNNENTWSNECLITSSLFLSYFRLRILVNILHLHSILFLFRVISLFMSVELACLSATPQSPPAISNIIPIMFCINVLQRFFLVSIYSFHMVYFCWWWWLALVFTIIYFCCCCCLAFSVSVGSPFYHNQYNVRSYLLHSFEFVVHIKCVFFYN